MTVKYGLLQKMYSCIHLYPLIVPDSLQISFQDYEKLKLKKNKMLWYLLISRIADDHEIPLLPS